MRVLLVNQVFHPDPQATSQYLSRLAAELVQRGHDVTVLAGQRDYDDPQRRYPERETWRGVRVIRVWSTGPGGGSKMRRALNFLSFLTFAKLRCFLLPRHDLVVTLTSPPLLSVLGAGIAFLWQARLACWVMDLNPDEAVAVGWLDGDGLAARLLEAASRWSLSRASRIVVLDAYMRDRIAAKAVPAEKIAVVPLWTQPGIEFDPAGRERFRREHGLEDKYVVMYSGNHTPCHPLDTLFAAAELLRENRRVQFCFIGGGIEWARLRDRARSAGLANTTFLGYQPFDGLAASLSAADTHVVVMGDPFVGIVHPSKVYNILGVRRPFIYIGPERSHVADLIREAGLGGVTAQFRHGEGQKLANLLACWADQPPPKDWPAAGRLARWNEEANLDRLISILGSC